MEVEFVLPSDMTQPVLYVIIMDLNSEIIRVHF